MQFIDFKKEIQKNFKEMTENATHLFEAAVDKDDMWNFYLDSYPAGTNEIFRERREHDCSCCRQFVKAIGNAVVIENNQIKTIWGVGINCSTYGTVAKAMDSYIKSKAVADIYFSAFKKVGTDKNFEDTDGKIYEWDHFYLELPSGFVNNTSKSLGDLKGSYRDVRNVFKRSLDEITEESVLTLLELIAQKSLYKGEEWKYALTEFLKYKKTYDKLSVQEKELYAWEQSVKAGTVVGKIRNHSIGTLLVNISEGMDLDTAVKKYEAIVAPSNYKRPKAIFTQKMLEDAKKKIVELGYMDSLPRRFATLEDISVNDILFSNKDSAKVIGGLDIFDDMAKGIPVNPNKFSKVEEISIEDFIKNVLPITKELEILLENKHKPNMVSLIAPQNKDSQTMFKWGNNFGWSYSGNITDSELTQMVRNAGGRIDGVLRFSHSWNHEGMRNGSLMDLHVFMPNSNQQVEMVGGKEIHDNYGNGERVGWNHRNHYISGGTQDVDYTQVAPVGYIPVENITFPSMGKLKDGVYTFKIHNWNFRNPTSGGFKAEIAFGGEVYKFVRKEPLQHKEWITLAKIELKNGQFKILEMAENDTSATNMWGVTTQQFVPVSVVMHSPNHWDEANGVGHKHYFFMLKGCVNDETPNGFFNEFLKPELNEHKRVFEALGSKMRVQDANSQLSGVGFSSTKRGELVVKVKGVSERTLKIKF